MICRELYGLKEIMGYYTAVKCGNFAFKVACCSKGRCICISHKKKKNCSDVSNNAAERSDKGPLKVSIHHRTNNINDSLDLFAPESRARVRSETLETMQNNRMELPISTESLGTYMNRGSKRQVSIVQGGMGRGCTVVAWDL